jgi:hypothetical protein
MTGPIGVEVLNRLGIDSNNQLYLDGGRTEIRRFLNSAGLQTWFPSMAALSTIATKNASVFLCAPYITLLSGPDPSSR